MANETSRSAIESKIMGSVQSRLFTVERSKISEGKRTVELSFSSEVPVARWWGTEILDHGKESVRLARLNAGAAVLVDHRGDQIGVVEEAAITDKKGRALLRFSKSTRGEEVFRDIVDDIRRNVSVSYEIHRMVIEEETDAETIYRIMDWEPLEISIVGVPADQTVGVGRARETGELTPARTADNREGRMAGETNPAGTVVPPVVPVVPTPPNAAQVEGARAEDIRRIEKDRIRGIENLCSINKIDDKYKDYWVRGGFGLDKVTDDMLQIMEERGKANPQSVSKLGLTERETQSFSLVRAIQAAVENNWTMAPFEAECSREISKQVGRQPDPRKFFVPYEIQSRSNRTPIEEMAYRMMKRDLTAGVGGAGGFLVQTSNVSFIELLRNRSVLFNMGATRLSGLRDNITIPKQTVAATTTWLANEASQIAESTQTFVQIALSPKNVGGYTEISRQLMLQSNPAIEGIVSSDLATVVALDIDLKGLNGSGASGQPTGILNTAGVGAVVGTTLGYAGIVEFQSDVFAGNALNQSAGYVTTGAVAGLLKTRVKFTSTASPIWDGRLEEANVDGYRGMASNQMPAATMLFGDFGQIIVAEWGVLEIEVNPFADFKAGIIGIRAIATIDIGVRYPTAFSVATTIT